MPVFFKIKHSTPLNVEQTESRTARGRAFDRAVAKLAPVFIDLISDERPPIMELADKLNAMGIIAPSGGHFSYETTRRVWKRLARLGFCEGPMTQFTYKTRLAKRVDKRRADAEAAINAKYTKS
jgi:hypothetical protein